ncbi:783_t:CDS:2, partial [Dentiscutata heterogama]
SPGLNRSNHYVQRLKDIGTTDYEVSTITWHRSLSGIARYERPKDGVQQFALNNLIASIDSSETITATSNTQLSLPANTLSTNNLYQRFKSARQIYQGNTKVSESTLQLTDPPILSNLEALAPTTQIANHPALSNQEAPTLTLLANSSLRYLLQPISNNYVKTQELQEI